MLTEVCMDDIYHVGLFHFAAISSVKIEVLLKPALIPLLETTADYRESNNLKKMCNSKKEELSSSEIL